MSIYDKLQFTCNNNLEKSSKLLGEYIVARSKPKRLADLNFTIKFKEIKT